MTPNTLISLVRPLLLSAAVGALFMGVSCVKHSVEGEEPGKAIQFQASSLILREDAITKTGTLKYGTDFSSGDSFYAWAWHDDASQFMVFGEVTKGQLDWDYDSHLYWNWRGMGDYYDFLAVYPGDIDEEDLTPPSPTSQTQQSSLLKATVIYDATSVDGQYDLMAAGYRRNDLTVVPVHLTFSHLLSAVSLDVKNADASLNTITLKSCKFVNLVTSAPVSVTFNGSSLLIATGVPDRSLSPVLGPSIPVAGKSLTPGLQYGVSFIADLVNEDTGGENLDLAKQLFEDQAWNMTQAEWDEWLVENADLVVGLNSSQLQTLFGHLYNPAEWDLMVPQDLDPSSGTAPSLEVTYDKGDGDITQAVDLKDIKNQNNEAITLWESGIRYSYLIELRIGVGIVVTVQTTAWDTVEAETPGLMVVLP